MLTKHQRAEKLCELSDWVETVIRTQYPGYLTGQIRPCWPHHPEARWEPNGHHQRRRGLARRWAPAIWPWAEQITTAWQRIQAIPHPPDQRKPIPPSKRGIPRGPVEPRPPGPPAGPPSHPDPKIQAQKPATPPASGSLAGNPACRGSQ
jgi:hypothetical protein